MKLPIKLWKKKGRDAYKKIVYNGGIYLIFVEGKRLGKNMDKVLIVDDDRKICRCLQQLIDWKSIHCLSPKIAYDGLTALEMIREENPDIIITDLRMPIINGSALCEEVYKLYTGIDMIFFSAYEDFQSAQMAIRYGVSDYILKPINGESLDSIQKIICSIQKRRGRYQEQKQQSQQTKDQNDVLVESVINIVSKEYGNPNLSVEEIASRVGFSADYLGKMFVNQVGNSVYSYILDYRIKKAISLLTDTKLSVTEVARRVGYVYPNYFAKVFKERQGMSPSEFRHSLHRVEKS